MKLPGIIFSSKLLCEEIRQEKNNKYILLGVYSGNILLSSLPGHIPLALFIETIVEKPGSHTYWLRISGPGEGHFEMQLNSVTTEEEQVVHVTSPRLDVLMECEGTLKIDVSSDEKAWKPLIRKTITQADGLWSLSPIANLREPEIPSPADKVPKKSPSRPRESSSGRKPRS